MSKVVLLVDDDADDRELFAEALLQINEAVRSLFAKNGYEALEVLLSPNSKLPDYIFLDLNMPLMGGKDCLKRIKEIPLIKDIPVIVLTTSKQPEDKEEMIKLGAWLYITKPDYFDKLVYLIRSVLSKNPDKVSLY